MTSFTVRVGQFSGRWRWRPLILGAVLGVCTLMVVALAVALGSYTLSPGELWQALTGQGTETTAKVVLQWRAPRAVSGAVFGAALGLSGAVFQSLLRNPLASPDIIGFTTGSYTGVLVVILAGGVGFAATATGALAGGLLTTLCIYLLAFRRGVQGFRLIIVGIAVSALLTSVNTWITVRADLALALRAALWGAGSLSDMRWEAALPGIGSVAIFMLLLAAVAPVLRELELGDDTAAVLGRRVERAKLALIVAAVGLIAAVTAVAGPIGFIALAAPQIARRMTRAPGIPLIPAAMVGAFGLTGADVLAQHALPGTTVPVGAVTVCLGGMYLLWLLIRETGRR